MSKFRLIFVVLFALFFASSIHAADIAVDADCSLADAIIAANRDRAEGNCPAGRGADTIILSQDITLDGNMPKITSDITIEGNDYTISGAGRHSIFYVEEGAHLAVKDLIMIKGKARYCRQPDLNADLTITGCIDEDYVKVGGAISNLGELTIANSSFRDNSAQDGGAISNGGELTITNSAFRSNSAENGGAINNHEGTVTIANSTFSNNSATRTDRYGGQGGAIFNVGRLTITNSTFSNNSTKKISSGGAIFNVGRLTITNSTFSSNSAEWYGGAIVNRDKLSISDSSFSDNSAERGGAITSIGELSVTNSAFSNNSAERKGGAIESSSGKLAITDSIFNGNSAENAGAIEIRYTAVIVTDSSFSDNSATESGGAIVNDENTELSIANSSFSDHSAYRDGVIGNRGKLTITNSSFTDNTAAFNGGAISNYKGTVTITNSSFSDNSADEGNGGGLFANAGIVTLSHVTIANNAAGHGGGIYVVGEEYDPLLNLHNSIIDYNMGIDCFAETIGKNRGNLIEDGSCFAELSGDPMLDELAEPEDGSPAYFPLLKDSPAIGAAHDDHCSEIDQIGTKRPQGAGCDIGAIEFVGSSE